MRFSRISLNHFISVPFYFFFIIIFIFSFGERRWNDARDRIRVRERLKKKKREEYQLPPPPPRGIDCRCFKSSSTQLMKWRRRRTTMECCHVPGAVITDCTYTTYLSTYLPGSDSDWLTGFYEGEREWEKLVVVSPMGLLASSWRPTTDQEQQQQSIVCWIWDDRPTSTKVWPARGLFVSSVAVFWLRSLISSFVINRQKA